MKRGAVTLTLLAGALLLAPATFAAADGQTPSMPPSAQSATPGMPPADASATPTAPPGSAGTEKNRPEARRDKEAGSPDNNAGGDAGAQDKDAPEPGTAKTFHDIEFVWIPAGSFTPGLEEPGKTVVTKIGGREEWFSDEAPRPKERFSRGFWMSKTEITRRQWNRVMGSQPWAEHNADDQLDVPAAWVTWKDAVAFTKTLAEEGDPAFRLPTENEWEYACRAGAATLFPFGDDQAKLEEYGWYRGNAPDGKPRPVAGKQPNAWGLCDMLGNVWEWCSDAYGTEPAAEGVDLRVLRGGAANQPATFTRPTVRMGRPGKETGARVGFRIVREP